MILPHCTTIVLRLIWGLKMVTAFVLINIDGKDIRGIANDLLSADGVTEVYPIAGEYDLLCILRVNDNSTLSRIVTEEIIKKEGVRTTKTLFALDAYAKVDLEEVFR